MIELRGLVAADGMEPLTATIVRGEVVAMSAESARARDAFLAVLAGRTPAAAGEVRWAPGAGPRDGLVWVRNGDELPLGEEPRLALEFYAAAYGLCGPLVRRRIEAALSRRPAVAAAEPPVAVLRGLAVEASLWILDGLAKEQLSALLSWLLTPARRSSVAVVVATREGEPVQADQHWGVRGDIAPHWRAPQRSKGGGPLARRRPQWAALWRLLLGRAIRPRRLPALVAVGGALAALGLAVARAHEGYWYGVGETAALSVAARLTAALAGLVAAASAASLAVVEIPTRGQTAVFGETPLGASGIWWLRLATTSLCAFAVALGASPAAVWAYRAGAAAAASALGLAGAPLACGIISAAIVALAVRRAPADRWLWAAAGTLVGGSLAVALAGGGLLW